MAAGSEHDYTRQRVNTWDARRERMVVKCPKCGRNGAYHRSFYYARHVTPATVVHVEILMAPFGGIAASHASESCLLTADEEARIPGANPAKERNKVNDQIAIDLLTEAADAQTEITGKLEGAEEAALAGFGYPEFARLVAASKALQVRIQRLADRVTRERDRRAEADERNVGEHYEPEGE